MLRIERLSTRDLTTLATDRGPVPMNIGAVLLFEGGADLSTVRAMLAERVPGVPRLRQRLLRPPLGCGRPVWVDDARFDLDHHFGPLQVGPAPGRTTRDQANPRANGADMHDRESIRRVGGVSEQQVLDAAAALVCRRLPQDRPLWAARWLRDVAGDRSALILVMHHVLADGIGGLAVLAALTDGLTLPPDPGFPVTPPRLRDLALDAARDRLRGLSRAPSGLAHVMRGLRELDVGSRPRRVDRTSLNRPTGSRRRVEIVRVPLAEVVSAAHATDHTVNDVVLAAVGGSFLGLLSHRGEQPDEIVVSVPISTRRTADAAALGNDVGVVPVVIPNHLDPLQRLRAIGVATARARAGSRGSSAEVLSGLFRLLGRLGVVQFFVDHQRLVHTFETNLRGPGTPLAMGGLRLARVVPIAVNPGNVGVSFDVLSYAGELVVSVVADPDVVPDQALLTELLADELSAYAAAPSA